MEKSIALIFVTLVSHISARAFSAPGHGVIILLSPIDSHVDQIHDDYHSGSEHDESSHSRQRRASYDSYSDYDNYNNYYEEEQPGGRPSRFDGSKDVEFNAIKRQETVPPPSPGTKYAYKPLFKYSSTNQKLHKLFVPNLFG